MTEISSFIVSIEWTNLWRQYYLIGRLCAWHFCYGQFKTLFVLIQMMLPAKIYYSSTMKTTIQVFIPLRVASIPRMHSTNSRIFLQRQLIILIFYQLQAFLTKRLATTMDRFYKGTILVLKYGTFQIMSILFLKIFISTSLYHLMSFLDVLVANFRQWFPYQNT